MVFVPGGDYRLVGVARPTDRRVQLDDYFIDKYEVSNQDYREFVHAGGYLKKEYWKHPFIENGRVLWRGRTAMSLFIDRTGLPGPRRLVATAVSDGRADHPVTGVSWYEAAAYAAFRGKELPTVFQWEKAARNGNAAGAAVQLHAVGPVLPRRFVRASRELRAAPHAGDQRRRLAPARSAPTTWRATSPNGRRTIARGFLTTGGAFGDPSYMFARFGGRPGFFTSERLGFRCARTAAGRAGDASAQRIELVRRFRSTSRPRPQVFAMLRERLSLREGAARRRGSSRRQTRPTGCARRSLSRRRMASAPSPICICRSTRRGRFR